MTILGVLVEIALAQDPPEELALARAPRTAIGFAPDAEAALDVTDAYEELALA